MVYSTFFLITLATYVCLGITHNFYYYNDLGCYSSDGVEFIGNKTPGSIIKVNPICPNISWFMKHNITYTSVYEYKYIYKPECRNLVPYTYSYPSFLDRLAFIKLQCPTNKKTLVWEKN